MKRIKLLLILLLTVLHVFSQNENNLKLYVGTFTSEGAEGIYLCNFNSTTGDISLEKTFKGLDNPSFLRISPDRKYLFAVSRATPEVEKTGGFVNAYKIEKNGTMKFLNKQVSNGAGPCHVDVSPDGKFVAIATYTGGTTSLFPVRNDGRLDQPISIIVNKGSGVDKNRQAKPHAHSIKFSPFDNQVYSADLGTDKLNIYRLIRGKLELDAQQFVKLASGAGPRHFDFHPNGKVIFVINELNSSITSFKRNLNLWKEFQTVSTLPAGFNGASYCADIHVSPNGKFLYGSNRGDNSIAIYAIEGTAQKLISMGTVSTEGNWPRNFVISPNRKYMLVANQKSGDITVFKINEEAGVPEYTGKKIKIPAPVCLEFL